MNNLYELTAEIEKLNAELQAADDQGDEATADVIIARIEALGLEADAKLSAIWRWMKNLEAEGAVLAEEAKRLYERKRRAEGRYESLKGHVATCLGEGRKWQEPGGVAAFGWRKSEAVKVESEDQIPDAWCVFERKPVLAEIKKTLKEGGEVPGALLLQRQNLQVK